MAATKVLCLGALLLPVLAEPQHDGVVGLFSFPFVDWSDEEKPKELPTNDFQCDIGFATWSSTEKEYCCRYFGHGCAEGHVPEDPKKDFDCVAGFANWEELWCEAKRKNCCRRFNRGCSPVLAAPATAPAPAPPTMAKKEASANTTTTAPGPPTSTTAPPLYNCVATSAASWERDWSHEKQAWCCLRAGLGCPTGVTTSIAAYDCLVAFEKWQEIWSAPKQEWCCSKFKRGCVTTATSTTTSTVSSSTSTVTITTTRTSSSTSTVTITTTTASTSTSTGTATHTHTVTTTETSTRTTTMEQLHNDYYNNKLDNGGWGGTCTCPNGMQYSVGDHHDLCATMACDGGTPGPCESLHSEERNGYGVICGRYTPQAKFDGSVPVSATSSSASLREVLARTAVGSAVLAGLAAVAWSGARIRRRLAPSARPLLRYEELQPMRELEGGLE